MAAARLALAAVSAGAVNFGDIGMYSGGAFVPDGDYILFFNTIMHQAKDKGGVAKGPIRLGTLVDFYPLDKPTEEAKLEQFYSMGSKADQFFAPCPETGKGIVPIPGAQGGGLNDKTNWAFLLKSLIDSGLPAGVFTNDLRVIDGVHVHIQNVDEPAERAGFASATAEVAQENRKPGKIAIVTEIKEGGAPWEGGGGLPDAAVGTKKTTTVARPALASAAKPGPRVAPKPPVAAAGGEDEAVREAASAAIAEVIMKKPNGLPRLALRTETFTAAKKASGEEVASAIISTFFEPGGEDALGLLLAELGYSIQGAQVKPAA